MMLAGCGRREAVREEYELGEFTVWAADTVLRAGGIHGRLIAPLRVLPLNGDTLVVSDVISNRLEYFSQRNRTVTPVGSKHYRPAPPLFLTRIDSEWILASRPQLLEAISVRTGERKSIPAPATPWGDSSLGPIAISGGFLYVAPVAAGIFYLSRAPYGMGSLTSQRFRLETSATTDQRFFGPRIPRDTDYVAAFENMMALAGMRGDTLFVVNLFTASVMRYAVASSEDVMEKSEPQHAGVFDLGKGFRPVPSRRVSDSPGVIGQPQLRDAVIVPNSGIAVLRNVSFHWLSSDPRSHHGGYFAPDMALELYSFDGKRLRGVRLEGDAWRSLAADDAGNLWLSGVGDGEDPSLPVLLRFSVPHDSRASK
jgi:hypothetical protein